MRLPENKDKSPGCRRTPLRVRALMAATAVFFFAFYPAYGKIDRFALVTRHNIQHSSVDSLSSLTVGNGGFAFTVDITGLQTFPKSYENGIPLGTMAEWAWHSFPNDSSYSLNDVVKYYKVGRDSVPYYFQYPSDAGDRKGRATAWLRENPHRFHLGLVGLELRASDSTEATLRDIENPTQRLNLWTGEITSEFRFDGVPVRIVTLCDQFEDRVQVAVESRLIRTRQLKIKLQFSYARHEKFNPGYDVTSPDKHRSQIMEYRPHRCLIKRQLDNTVYYSRVDWEGGAAVLERQPHTYLIQPDGNTTTFRFAVAFSDTVNRENPPAFSETVRRARAAWRAFWTSGGAIDFSGCGDPRAFELERRVVLSDYLTKIQCTGKYPPQETGLTFNSWHGKFHLEMHWWHGVHHVLWNRADLFERQLSYYHSILGNARKTAAMQGYKGVRWPKMTDPRGRESPSTIGVFLIWQQPHVIYYADLLYRSKNRSASILQKYRDLVFETADFMASYARFDSLRNEYVLGPAIMPAQERFFPDSTVNPSFELAYWRWGLETAQTWRERLGLQRDKEWQKVIDRLSPLPILDSLYLFTETAKDSYANYLTDHPMVLGLLGFLPDDHYVDRNVLLNTQKAVIAQWKWESCWGWDFPLVAMNAAALGDPGLAVEILLMNTPKNTFLMNGHNYQDRNLPLYLPGNGGLLTAAAMVFAPGDTATNPFWKSGAWKAKCEKMESFHCRRPLPFHR
jgi:protein-glucosylgalactosylhydroxylysine glucosidase